MATIEVQENQIEYYGHALRVFSVRLDGQLVSDSFQRFDASTEAIASRICKECYASTGGGIATCGNADIAVRRHEDCIYWFLADHEYVEPLIPNVPLNHVWAFPLEDYELLLNGNASGLPDFNLADIKLILKRATIYRPELGLYTIPDLDDDPQGRRLLDVIARLLDVIARSSTTDLRICPPPADYRTIRVGIESEGIPETVVEIGMVNHRCAVRFVAHPSFPLWLTSDILHHDMTSIAAGLSEARETSARSSLNPESTPRSP